jgi:uncharacterized protein (TIGR02757 family)
VRRRAKSAAADRRSAGSGKPRGLDRNALERLYLKYNDRRFVATDPVEFVHRYEDPRDREIAALVASSLAFGNVKQIRGSVGRALEILGPAPAERVAGSPASALDRDFRGFRHRWITGADMAALLGGARRAIGEYGSLGALFGSMLGPDDTDVAPAAGRFARALRGAGGGYRQCLLPSPESGSACKRLNLFLRWMVRSDAVDPGCWRGVSPAMLLVPLDTHMHRFALRHGLTSRRAADLRAAREVTAAFRGIAPEDPVKYDFALTRLGMLRDGGEETDAGIHC